MHRRRLLRILPRLVGSVSEDRREQPRERIENARHHRLRGAAAGRIRGVAVEAVLRDVHVERADLHGHELIQRLVHLAEIVFRIRRTAGADDALKAREHPAINERRAVERRLARVEIREVRQQDAQDIAEAPIRLREPLEALLGKRHLVLIVHARRPQPHDVCTVGADEMLGVHRLRVSPLLGFRDLLARVFVHDKAVRDDRAIRRAAIHRDARHERRLEPAAVLIRRFEIHIRRPPWPAEFRALRHHGGVGNAGVDPHIERVVAPRGARREAEHLRPFRVVLLEPQIRAVLLYEVGDLARIDGVEQRLAVCVVKDRQRHAPGPLAGNAPVWP